MFQRWIPALVIASYFTINSNEIDDSLTSVGLGPDELAMLDDFEVKLLRDSIRGVGSVSRGFNLNNQKDPLDFDLTSFTGMRGTKQKLGEVISVGGGFSDLEPEIVTTSKPQAEKPATGKPKHSLKARRKKPKKTKVQKEDNTDVTLAEQTRLAALIEAVLQKKRKAINDMKKARVEDWEDVEQESDPIASGTPTTELPDEAPVTLTQNSQFEVNTDMKTEPPAGRRGLSMITEQDEENNVDMPTTDIPKQPRKMTVQKSKVFRGDERIRPVDTEDVLNSHLVDNEVAAKDPRDWEEKMRALTRELGFVLQKLKVEKESIEKANKTSHDPKPTSITEISPPVDANTNNVNDNDRTPLQRKAYVSILREGVARQTDINEYVFTASITLIRDQNKIILVDTGLATDINGHTDLLSKLSKLNITPPEVNYVITTHGHPDHSGNTNDFPDAIHFQGNMLHHHIKFNFSDLFEKDSHQLTPNVQLIKTPGHTPDDISVIVKNTDKYGTVSVSGDVFITEEDMEFPLMWKPMAWNERIQEKSRQRLLCESDYIIPGHGKVFKVKDDMRIKAQCSQGQKIK